MFIGEYISQLGDKNRVSIPKKLREQLNGSLYITRGYEGCLIIVDHKRWEKLVDDISRNSLLSLDIRDSKRFILGGALEIEPDSQGRFVIAESLIDYSSITNKVIFIGVGDWIELWDSSKWKSKLETLSANVSDIAERISNL